MENITIEVYSIIILAVLFLDYHKQNKNKYSLGRKLFTLNQVGIIVFALLAIYVKVLVNYNLPVGIYKWLIHFVNFILAISTCLYLENKFTAKGLIINSKKRITWTIYFLLIIGFIAFEYIFLKFDVEQINPNNYCYLTPTIPLIILFFALLIEKSKDNLIPMVPFNVVLFVLAGHLFDFIINDFFFTIMAYTIANLLLYIYKNNKEIYKDSLTGLYNRKILQNEIYNDLLITKNMVGIFLIDIDKFKTINDTYGHQVGDNLLIKTAEILRNSTRESDYVIRLGGDEFLLIVALNKAEEITCIYNRILANLKSYNANKEIKIELSIGYDLYLDSKEDFYKLVDLIDKKMYKDKQSKRLKN